MIPWVHRVARLGRTCEMTPALRLAIAYLVGFAAIVSSTSVPVSENVELGPSEAAARQNAFDIFNAIHSAMRQWGSSLNHNGMSLFLATVPAGVILHHGTNSPTPPPGPEWLAFEIEHAELFAHPRWQGGPPPSPQPPPHFPSGQHPLSGPATNHNRHQHLTNDDNDQGEKHGYLHTYRTTTPLHLLYLDGTSAGNTAMGTLDTQDLLLRLNRSAPLWDERARARALCDIVVGWGLHGVLRMEAGFEVIQCDFSSGMELVSAHRRPSRGREEPGSGRVVRGDGVGTFEYVRAVARRYHGIGGGRVLVDWGSMVSAFFYEVDLTGGSEGIQGKKLPRLVGVGDAELKGIRARVEEVVEERRGGGKRAVDWQGVVDLVVARYADRLRYMFEGVTSAEVMQDEVNGLLDTHIDYAMEDDGYQGAIRRCTRFYTSGLVPARQEDCLILTAIETVTYSICSALFEVRKLVVVDQKADDDAVKLAKNTLRKLRGQLRWTRWKECAACRFDEVCFVPMWPFGDKDSHERPNCRNATTVNKGWWEADSHYWQPAPGMWKNTRSTLEHGKMSY